MRRLERHRCRNLAPCGTLQTEVLPITKGTIFVQKISKLTLPGIQQAVYQKTHRAVCSIVRGFSRTCLPGRARHAPLFFESFLGLLRFSIVPLHVPFRKLERAFSEHGHEHSVSTGT